MPKAIINKIMNVKCCNVALPVFILIYLLKDKIFGAFYSSYEYPIMSVVVDFISAVDYFGLLYLSGHFLFNLIHKNNIEANRPVYTVADYIAAGLLYVICIGIFGGIIGILSSWYYGVTIALLWVCYLIYVKKDVVSSEKLSAVDWTVIGFMIVISILLFSSQLIYNITPIHLVPDIFGQHLPQIDVIINSGKLIPCFLAHEVRVHEYYYTILTVLPPLLPSSLRAVAFISLGFQIFICVFTYLSLIRIYGRTISLFGSLLCFMLFMSMYRGNAMLVLVKTPARIFSLLLAFTSLYMIRFIKDDGNYNKNNTLLWLSVLSASLLCGSTIVGTYFSTIAVVAVLLLFVHKRISGHYLIISMVSLFCGFAIVKVINYYYSGSFVDYITICFLGFERLKNMVPFNEYFSNIDWYVMQNICFGKNNEANTVVWSIILLKKMIFKYSGLILCLSVCLALVFQARKLMGQVIIAQNAIIMLMLYATSAIILRQSVYIVYWYAIAFSHVMSIVLDVICEYRQVKNRTILVRILPVMLCAILAGYIYSNDSRAIKITKQTILNISSVHNIFSTAINESIKAVKLQRLAFEFVNTSEYKSLKSKMKDRELVYAWSVAYPYLFLANMYNLTPIRYSSILNRILYYENPEVTVGILKKLGIRYILLTKMHIDTIIKPPIFEKKYAGRYLRILGYNYVPESVLSAYEYSRPAYTRMNDRGIFLEILYEKAEKDDPAVLKLVDEVQFSDLPGMDEALANTKLDNEMINRIQSHIREVIKQ